MSAHTPAPWVWCGSDLDSATYEEVIKAEVSCGAFCYGGCVSMTISDANRALIAAAPDLLAALKAALAAGIIDIDGEPDAARAAIAKATGGRP